MGGSGRGFYDAAGHDCKLGALSSELVEGFLGCLRKQGRQDSSRCDSIESAPAVFDGLRTKGARPESTCQLARLFQKAGRPVCQAGRPLGEVVFCLVRELLASVAVRRFCMSDGAFFEQMSL